MTVTGSLRETRDRIVREHMESENRHEFDVALATFKHPRYELVATGEVIDGATDVAEYYRETRAAFPDQRNEVIAIHHADDAVIVEFDLLGTHDGVFRRTTSDRFGGLRTPSARRKPTEPPPYAPGFARACPAATGGGPRHSS